MKKPMTSLRQQRGWALTETLLAIGAFMLIMAIAGPMLMERVRTQRVAATARQLVDLSNGAIAYQSAYLTTITGASGPTTPYTQSVAQLIAAGALSTNFSATNRYGQSLFVSWVTPASGVPQPVIVGTGGVSINDGELVDIANEVSAMKGEGAFISNSAPTVIQCAQGTCNPVALSTYGYGALPGRVAVALFKQTQTNSDVYLHRTNDGIAAHGTMYQAINMNANALNNASDVKMQAANEGMTMFGGGEKVYGTSDYGIALQTNYALRSKVFNDGHTEFYNYLSVPGGGNGLYVGGSAYYGDSANMALRPAANGGTVYIQGTTSGGGTANLYVTGNTTTVGSLTVGGNVQVNGSTNINGNHTVWGNSYSNGTTTSNGQLITNSYLQVNGGANKGWGCSPNGQLAQAADGSGFVQCAGGIWKSTAAGAATVNVQSATLCHNNNNPTSQSVVAMCPAGYHVTGGGSQVMGYNPIYGNVPASSAVANTPDASVPYGNQGWQILVGGAEGWSCFAAVAVCSE